MNKDKTGYIQCIAQKAKPKKVMRKPSNDSNVPIDSHCIDSIKQFVNWLMNLVPWYISR